MFLKQTSQSWEVEEMFSRNKVLFLPIHALPKENICRAGFAPSQRLESELRPSVTGFIHSAQPKAIWEVHEEIKSVDCGIGDLPFKKTSFFAEGRQV